MLRLYRSLLTLYPAMYRDQFSEEMVDVFNQARAESNTKKPRARAIFWIREATGLLAGALREHARAFGAGNWLAFPTRRFAMRNGFRFPKTTAVLMTIILAGVIVAIRKGEAIEASLRGDASAPIGPIHSAPSYLLPGVVAGFLFFYAAGVIGWAILFALRRSGVHRLDEMPLEK